MYVYMMSIIKWNIGWSNIFFKIFSYTYFTLELFFLLFHQMLHHYLPLLTYSNWCKQMSVYIIKKVWELLSFSEIK